MNEDNDLFLGFTSLEPSTSESSDAIERTRAAILDAEKLDAGKLSRINRESGRKWLRPRLAIAAALLILAGVAWMVMMGERPLMADIIEQLMRSKSVRCVTEHRVSIEDERVGKSWEFLYDRERGFSKRTFDVATNAITRIEIDDGIYHWAQAQGNKTVTRSKSVSAQQQFERLLNPLDQNRGKHRFIPSPENDRVISGTQCRCFVSHREAQPIDGPRRQMRNYLWVDKDNRLLQRTEEFEKDGQWTLGLRTKLEYDVEFKKNAFEPSFGSDSQIVDVSKLMDEMFSLTNAVHREQHCGYDLAVHDIKRLGDYKYFLMMSFRPTQATRDKLNLVRGEAPGELHGSSRTEHRLEPRHETEHEGAYALATARLDGVRVWAFVCKLTGIDTAPLERAQPGFTVFAHARLWDEVKAISQVSMDIPLPDEITSLREVVRSTYDTMANLESIPRTSPIDELQLIDELDNRVFVRRVDFGGGAYQVGEHEHAPRPSEIDFETFFNHIRATSPFGENSTTTTISREE